MAPKSTTVQIGTPDVVFLAKRGARSHRGGGEFNRSVVLHRSLQTLRVLLDSCDPRKSKGLAPAFVDLATSLLPAPWTLKPFEIEHLPTILERAPEFEATVAAAGVEARELLAALAALSFAEKVWLVDQAVQAQAPAASAATPEEF
ncbi:MAG TPA: hypothetical protein VHR45_14085 [Thermoanaerobaculia bacterium]|nr:hypothetical protein [Thermoanaerobaculia bacterium]